MLSVIKVVMETIVDFSLCLQEKKKLEIIK